MKILLIYPTTTTNGKPDKYLKAFLPPLSLSILDRLTYLANPKHEVRIINESVEDVNFNSDCDLVGITSLTSQATRAYQIADKFRLLKKKVILGGVHPSLLPDESLKHADAVLIGEAENLWEQILSDAELGQMKQIYRNDYFPDLERLLIPKWDSMDLSIYRRSFGRRMPRMPIYTTRGCVHRCNFCSVSKFFGRSYRCKPISNVLEEINSITAESYFFTDDNIVCKPDYSEELFKALKTSLNRKIRWFSQSSTTLVNRPDLINLAATAGCRSLFFGIESINSNNLSDLKKKFNDPQKYIDLFQRCAESNIQAWFSMIFGFDGDSLDSMIETVEFLKQHNIWNIVFWILTPLPGTDLWDDMVSSDRIMDFPWEKFDLNHVVFQPQPDSSKQLLHNFWTIYISMYDLYSIIQRSFHSLKVSGINGFITSLINQFYAYNQIKKREHPYSMGLWKKN